MYLPNSQISTPLAHGSCSFWTVWVYWEFIVHCLLFIVIVHDHGLCHRCYVVFCNSGFSLSYLKSVFLALKWLLFGCGCQFFVSCGEGVVQGTADRSF